jgi:hypothetical protein
MRHSTAKVNGPSGDGESGASARACARTAGINPNPPVEHVLDQNYQARSASRKVCRRVDRRV